MKEQLLQARDLIQAKRFDEARQLLNTLDHPKAREWLAKLDEMAPKPAPPVEEVDLADLFTAAKPTTAHVPLSSEATHQRLVEARDLIKAKRYEQAAEQLRGIEHPTADKMREVLREVEIERLKTARQWRSIFRGLVFMMGVAAIGAIIVFVGLRDATYDDPLIQFGYRFPYHVAATCSTPLTGCRVELEQYFTPNATITIQWKRLPAPTNVGVLRDDWTEKFNTDSDLHYISMLTTTERGYPTLFVKYSSNHDGALHEVLYHTEYLMVKDNDLIEFSLQGQESAYQFYESDFNRWLQTVEFKQ